MIGRSRGMTFWCLALGAALSLAWLAPAVFAQVDPPAAGGVDLRTGTLPTLTELFETSPRINGTILGLSVIALLLFVYFMLSIRTANLAPPALVDDLTKLILAGKYEDAATICRNERRVFLATIIQRCLENAGKQHSVIMDMIDTEGKRRADIVWNRISYLADISNVAPMLGLFGTVVGMMNAFFKMPLESMSIASRMLTQSIAQAMATTFFGLIVAMVALVFYSLVKARTTRTLAEVEQIVHSLADHIKRGHQ